MDIIVTITEFKKHLKTKGYADITVHNYGKALDQFKGWLLDHGIRDIRKISRQTILDYQKEIMEESCAMETKASKIRAVKRLFEYLLMSHKLIVNPTEGVVETCRRNQKIKPVLTQKEMQNLLSRPDLKTQIGIRDRAIMEVMYATGIRLSELIHIEVDHVSLKDKVIQIRKGKGNKQRVVPLGNHAADCLKTYITQVRPWYVRKRIKERLLFITQYGNPLTQGNLNGLLNRYRRQAGIKKSTSPHMFRRTCATHLILKGVDIRYVQELLGHKYLRTTQYYIKVRPVEVKETHTNTHPGVNDNEN
ncbi:MAG: tyrosine-type recombinase/integrase [Gammaproteobacteria bacterium]|nr:tyrosine-type recombinase/integrase [Gammaproteobacteria bacterium]